MSTLLRVLIKVSILLPLAFLGPSQPAAARPLDLDRSSPEQAMPPAMERVEQAMADELLEDRVADALFEALGADARDIVVTASRGAVFLEGTVGSRSSRALAIDVARDVEGVTVVDTALDVTWRAWDDVGPRDEVVGLAAALRDAALVSDVQLALLDAFGADARTVVVRVEGGVVVLGGEVYDHVFHDEILGTVRELEGVDRVRDELRVTPRETDQAYPPWLRSDPVFGPSDLP